MNPLTADQASFMLHTEGLPALRNEHLLRSVDCCGLATFPAVVRVQLLLHHAIHHRGQLSTYLRPMGGKVPPMYGPSHDTGGFTEGRA